MSIRLVVSREQFNQKKLELTNHGVAISGEDSGKALYQGVEVDYVYTSFNSQLVLNVCRRPFLISLEKAETIIRTWFSVGA